MTHSNLNISSNQLTEKLFLGAPLGIACVSTEGKFLEVNPKLCEMLGYSRDDFMGLTVFDITAPEDLGRSYDRLEKITSKSIKGFDIEKRYIKKDGSFFWVRVVVKTVYDDQHEIDYFVSTFEDISEKIQYQAQLIQNEKKYRTILDTTSQGFWVVDFDQNICEVNRAYCQMTGYTRDELLGMKITDLDADEDSGDVAGRQKNIKEIGSVDFITHHRRKDGSVISFSVATSYEPSLGNYIFAFFHDRTEIEETIEALNLTSEIAKEAKETVMTISENTLRQIGQELHDDLGQKLTGAAMISASLKSELELKGQLASRFEQLNDLLTDAVKRTRLISHSLYPVELDDNGLVAMVRSLVDRVNYVTGLEIQFESNKKNPELNREQSLHLYRIIQEAITNLIRHSGADQAKVRIQSLKHQLLVEIQDNGVGLKDHIEDFKNGVGIKSMQYRAEKIGAQILFKNLQAGGLLIQISLHL